MRINANISIPRVVYINRNINMINNIDKAFGMTEKIDENSFSKLLNRFTIL